MKANTSPHLSNKPRRRTTAVVRDGSEESVSGCGRITGFHDSLFLMLITRYTFGVSSVDVYSVIDVSEVRAVSIFRVLSNIIWDLKVTDSGFHDSLLLILITLFGFDLSVDVDSRTYVSEVKSSSIFRVYLTVYEKIKLPIPGLHEGSFWCRACYESFAQCACRQAADKRSQFYLITHQIY